MPTVNNSRPRLHRKEWQFMTPCPVATTAGSFVIDDPSGLNKYALFVSSATVHYLYNHDDDAWSQIPSGALAGTFGAWSCGTYNILWPSGTATGWSTTTINTNLALYGTCVGMQVRITAWPWAGQTRTITQISSPWSNSTITVSVAFWTAITASSQFQLLTGAFYVLNAGTLAAWSFRKFDMATMAWTTLANTGLPATWGTDGKLRSTHSTLKAHFTGTASSATGTTLVTTSNFGTNVLTNMQVRITAGTGAGQVRTISSNTATTLTVPAWTVTPDATSTYVIEWNDDHIYIAGNNAVTLYRYSISGNTTTTLSPWVARGWAPWVWFGLLLPYDVSSTEWTTDSTFRNGRFLYSFRWGATGTLDIYDIALNTWSTFAYGGLAETFTTGSWYDYTKDCIFIKKDSTNRFFCYNLAGGVLAGFNTDLMPDWAAILWDKFWSSEYTDGATVIPFLYSLQNTGTNLRRIMLY